ncbi:MAG TPA: hypothetical protein VGD65_10105 [Chryseosolibacter sp.]
MKAIASILIFVIATSATAADANIDSLKKLGRAALIDLAVKKLDDKRFDPKQYDRITVKATKSELLVEFALSVRVERPGDCYFAFVWVPLAGMGTMGMGDRACKEGSYYKGRKRDKKHIAFVLDAINKSKQVGRFKDNQVPAGTTLTIIPEKDVYKVGIADEGMHIGFNMDKRTGDISDVKRLYYERIRDKEPRWHIITD